MDILEAVERYFTLKRVGRIYYSTYEHDSLIINQLKGTFNWYSKGIYGGVEKFFRVMGDNDSANEYAKETSFTIADFVKLTKPKEADTFEEMYGYSGGCEYLRKRGIVDATAEAWELEHTDDRIIFPTINHKNERAVIVRFTDPEVKTRYKNYGKLRMWPHPTAYALTLDPDLPIILFEGIFSVLRFWQVDNSIQAFAALTDDYTFPLSVFANFQKVCIISDADTAGFDAVMRAREIRNDIKFIYPQTMPDEMLNDEIAHTLEKVNKLCE